MPLIRNKTSEAAKEVEEAEHDGNYKGGLITRLPDAAFSKMVSTGSTVLDLTISGTRVRGGGIPAGTMVELYGPSGSGKTAVLAEICGSVQAKSGLVKFQDTEARLDKEYSEIYGVHLNAKDYSQPQTVSEMFDIIYKWKTNNNIINMIATDSLAALSTELELEKGDKMGMRRAKEFSEGLRKICVKLRQNNWLLVCTNQVRDSDHGEVTPGGKAIAFYSSLRIRISMTAPVERKIIIQNKDKKDDDVPNNEEEEKKDKTITRVIGIESDCYVKKSSLDVPYRNCSIFIMFGYGIDDIAGNLQYIKTITGSSIYDCLGKQYRSRMDAIKYIETNNLQEELRETTIDLWEETEKKFAMNRKPKIRR